MKRSNRTIGTAAFAPWVLALAVGALAGCSAMPPPVPVIGSPAEIARLEGAWDGEYSSDETLRSGSIAFTLAAGADTAFGDVLMLPRQFNLGRTPGDVQVSERPRPRNLPIRFVLTSGDRLTGMLDPYEDPECGCTLRTVFEGRVQGDTIQGTFTSTNTQTGEVKHGEWKVKRRDAATSAGSEVHR